MAADDDIPPFRLLLPPGWEERPADRETIQMLIARSSAVFRSTHRPDLDAQMRSLLEQAYRRMQSTRVFAIYLQLHGDPDDALPMSITAARVSGSFGGTLDRQVSQLVRERGAEPLDAGRQIMRWQADTTTGGDLSGVSARTVNYLIPIPGSGRREAISFTTTIPLPSNADDQDGAFADELVALSDVVISTFAWERVA